MNPHKFDEDKIELFQDPIEFARDLITQAELKMEAAEITLNRERKEMAGSNVRQDQNKFDFITELMQKVIKIRNSIKQLDSKIHTDMEDGGLDVVA